MTVKKSGSSLASTFSSQGWKAARLSGTCLEQPAEAAVGVLGGGGLEQPVAMRGGRQRLQPDIAPVEHLALGARARRPVLQVFAHGRLCSD